MGCRGLPTKFGKTEERSKAEENGYAERVVRSIKEVEVDLSEYLDFADVVSLNSRMTKAN